jgi:hypothetical protein
MIDVCVIVCVYWSICCDGSPSISSSSKIRTPALWLVFPLIAIDCAILHTIKAVLLHPSYFCPALHFTALYALFIFTLTYTLLSHLTTVQAQSGHRGLPTAPTITAALQSNGLQTSEEEASSVYEDWAVNRHSWMRNDLFGDDGRALNTGGHILKDYSSYLGDSPLFEANALSSSSLPRYSTLDTVSGWCYAMLCYIMVTKFFSLEILLISTYIFNATYTSLFFLNFFPVDRVF